MMGSLVGVGMCERACCYGDASPVTEDRNSDYSLIGRSIYLINT